MNSFIKKTRSNILEKVDRVYEKQVLKSDAFLVKKGKAILLHTWRGP
jgi:hypothetical protein